jgi:hypothetical protein
MVYAEGPHELHEDGIEAESFEALSEVALAKTNGARGLAMVCGAITTGGTGHQILNLEVFNATINGLVQRGIALFDQVPYEFGLRRLAREWEARGHTGYCMPILTTFYARLFSEKVITEGWFIPGWQSSTGARWEREWFLEHDRAIHDLVHEDVRAFMLAEHPEEHVTRVMSLLAQ